MYIEITVLLNVVHVTVKMFAVCVYICERRESSPWVQGRDQDLLHRHTEQQSSVEKHTENTDYLCWLIQINILDMCL